MRPLRRPTTRLPDRFRGDGVHGLYLYTSKVVVAGREFAHGRASGFARSEDGELELELELHLRLPRELGGDGGGTNPEQLLAAGYTACSHGAPTLLAERYGLTIPEATVTASIMFGRDPIDGLFVLAAEAHVALPGVEREAAEELIRSTERICPYTKVFRQGINSSVRLSNC